MTDDDPRYIRLGEMVRARRSAVHGSRAKASDASVPDVGTQTWLDVENGLARNYTDGTRQGIMHALGWTFESWDRILAGGEPELAPETAAAEAMRLQDRVEVLEGAVAENRRVIEDLAATFRQHQRVIEGLSRTLQDLASRLPGGPPAPRG